MNSKLHCLFFCFLISACTTRSALTKKAIEIDGVKRDYILYIPEGIASNPPFVVALHGYTDNDSSFMDYSGLNEIADKNGFAVCYPQGLKDSLGNTFWQVGYSFHKKEKVDDVKFLSELTVSLQKTYGFNSERTFVTGMSNGGDMCILLACRRPDLFRAVAPVVGCMMKVNLDSCRSSLPVPVFMINSTADKITWWDGDMNDTQHYGPYLPVPETFEFFVGKNKCTESVTDTIPDINTVDSSYVVTRKYSGGINGNQVWLYSVIQGGHDWPGRSGNMDFNASEEIWKFFSHVNP